MRFKQVKTGLPEGDETTIYLDKMVEIVEQGGSTITKTYIDDVAIISKEEIVGQPLADHKIRFTLRDRLGSVVTLVDHNNQITEHRSYDPFGKPRTGDFMDVAVPTLREAALSDPHSGDFMDNIPFTNRGFTDHEHLDDAELIHMNGRAYDYNLGRFLSVDPFIQSPGNSQSMNPYSYIMNNPLAGTDPSGYKFSCERNAMCETVWERPSGKLHFGTLTDENGVVRKVAIVSKVNVNTEDIGSTPIKDIESITIAGDNETTHITVGPTSGGTKQRAALNSSLVHHEADIASSRTEQSNREREAYLKSLMASKDPKDRQKAIDEAVKHFRIGLEGVSSLSYNENITQDGITSPNYNNTQADVEIGPRAFVRNSFGWLGSVIAHEVEVHVQMQMLNKKYWTGPQPVYLQEVQAYQYELDQAKRFGLTKNEIKDLRQIYYEGYLNKLNQKNYERAMRGDFSTYSSYPNLPRKTN
ncbi:RHS repeat domain-containing protein [Kangiella sp. M94]